MTNDFEAAKFLSSILPAKERKAFHVSVCKNAISDEVCARLFTMQRYGEFLVEEFGVDPEEANDIIWETFNGFHEAFIEAKKSGFIDKVRELKESVKEGKISKEEADKLFESIEKEVKSFAEREVK